MFTISGIKENYKKTIALHNGTYYRHAFTRYILNAFFKLHVNRIHRINDQCQVELLVLTLEQFNFVQCIKASQEGDGRGGQSGSRLTASMREAIESRKD